MKRPAIFTWMITLALLLGYMVVSKDAELVLHDNKAVSVMSIEEEPMISKDATTAYASGLITKTDARNQIDRRLDELKSRDAIARWEFRSEDSRYMVYMNNGVLFTYFLD